MRRHRHTGLAPVFVSRGRVSPQLIEQPVARDEHHRFQSGVHAELPKCSLDMAPCGLRADDQGAGHVVVVRALGKQCQYLPLAVAEMRETLTHVNPIATARNEAFDQTGEHGLGDVNVTATEAMLSAKQGAKALHFAEQGLAKARATGNRDLEGACLELSDAAKRQMK